MTDTRVFRRRVYHIGGYDPASPAVVHGRFVKELRRFERSWAASATVSELVVGPDMATWQIQAGGPNWRTETAFHLLRWDDVIAQGRTARIWRRLPSGLAAFLDFLLAGAFTGYLRTSWRYAMFFLYPLVIFALIVLVAAMAGIGIARAADSRLIGILAGVGVGGLAFHAAERWLHLGLLFDDWIFARQYIRHGDALIADRLRRVATEIAEARRTDPDEEIVIVGHSLGAVLAIDMIDCALASGLDRQDGRGRLAFLSVGASILKIGLHRAASRFRDAVSRVGAARGVFWADYRARSDVMNFYGGDPMRQMGLPVTGSPLIRNVSIRRMIAPARYPRIRRNWYRMHCQFVRGNDRPAPYDYFMFICGPVAAERLAASALGAMDFFDAEGRLSDSAQPAKTGEAALKP